MTSASMDFKNASEKWSRQSDSFCELQFLIGAMNIGSLYVWFQGARTFLRVTVVMVLMAGGGKEIFLFVKSCCQLKICE